MATAIYQEEATEMTALLRPATTPQDPKVSTLRLLHQFLEDAKPTSLFSRNFWVSKPKKIEFQAIKNALNDYQYRSIDNLFDISNNPDADEKTKYVKQLIQKLGIKYSFHHSDSKMRIMDALIQIVHTHYSQAGFLDVDLVEVLQQLITLQIAEHQNNAARVTRYREVDLPHDLDKLKLSLARSLADMETSITDIGKPADPSKRVPQTLPLQDLALFDSSLEPTNDDDTSAMDDWQSFDGSDLEKNERLVSELKYVVCTPMMLFVAGFIGLAIVANVAMPVVPVVIVTLAAVSLMAYGVYLMVKRGSANRVEIGTQAEMNLFAQRRDATCYSALSQVAQPSGLTAGR